MCRLSNSVSYVDFNSGHMFVVRGQDDIETEQLLWTQKDTTEDLAINVEELRMKSDEAQ